MDSNSPLGGLPSSGHWAKWSKPPCSLCNSWQLEKFEFCEAETIYIDRTFKASCSISSSWCMLCIMVSTSVTQSTTSQHLVHIDSIILYTLSIPTSSTSHFVNSHFVNSHFVNIDQMGIDQMGIDEVGSWPNGNWRSGNWQSGNWQSGKIPCTLCQHLLLKRLHLLYRSLPRPPTGPLYILLLSLVLTGLTSTTLGHSFSCLWKQLQSNPPKISCTTQVSCKQPG